VDAQFGARVRGQNLLQRASAPFLAHMEGGRMKNSQPAI
jgi:hypothetical protein